MRRGEIEVWRVPEVQGVELRQGREVTAPYPKHWHEEYQLCLVHSGAGHLNYRGAAHWTPSDTLFVVHPGEVHSNDASGEAGCSFRSLYLEPELVADVGAQPGRSRGEAPFFPRAVVADQRLVATFDALFSTLNQSESRLIRDSALLSLIELLVERYAENPPTDQQSYDEGQAVGRVRDYIHENYTQAISLDQLSRLAGLSPFHLNRTFRMATGSPPHAYQTQVRISRAKELLRGGTPIAEVAAAAGFVDQSHFTRHFKRLMAITPSRYCSNRKNVQDGT